MKNIMTFEEYTMNEKFSFSDIKEKFLSFIKKMKISKSVVEEVKEKFGDTPKSKLKEKIEKTFDIDTLKKKVTSSAVGTAFLGAFTSIVGSPAISNISDAIFYWALTIFITYILDVHTDLDDRLNKFIKK